MTPNFDVTRRNALKAIGATGAFAATGAAGLHFLSGPGAAAFTSDLQTTVATDDGDLSFVDLSVTDYYAVWDGFDVPVAAIAFRDELVHSSGDSHVLYDQRGDEITGGSGGPQPVLLEEISTKGDGGDGWGGPGEYASTSDTKTAPSINPETVNVPTGPATAGFVHANVGWRILSDDLSAHPALSVETPAEIGVDVPELDNSADGSTETRNFTLHKQVWFYQLDGNGETPVVTDRAGATVYPMTAGEDGTLDMTEAVPNLAIDVENELSTSNTDGDGSLNGG